MKTARIITKTFFYIFLMSTIIIFGTAVYLDNSLNKNLKIKLGESINLDVKVPVTAVLDGVAVSEQNGFDTVGKEYEVDLKMFGVIPFSRVNVQVVDEMHVAVLGTPFGMKIYTEGVLVTDFTSVNGIKGEENPAKNAGIKKGDYILSVNGKKIETNEDLSALVEASNGEKMNFTVLRNGTKIYISFCAVKSQDNGLYKIGIWVKDSSAGVGTLTFYSPANNIVCGLGHGICDDSTNELLSIETGEFVTADIVSIKRGESGAPGQLNGTLGSDVLGEIALNAENGVYAVSEMEINTPSLTEVALKNEVKEGRAQILCTVEGNEPSLYDCEIKIKGTLFSKTQNLIVTVIDERLLETTGGIVQGLSGSPILQNGKLVGAVTHVLIDDPTKGYGIFAENMLETAQRVADKQLKEAS